jgi:hypothetical protein
MQIPQVFVSGKKYIYIYILPETGACGKYPSFSKVGGNYPLDLKIIWRSGPYQITAPPLSMGFIMYRTRVAINNYLCNQYLSPLML